MDDHQLLERFARERSEAAFGQLVERYLGLVYSAALRQTSGDTHLAHDIAQLVFTNLATKAPELCRKMARNHHCSAIAPRTAVNSDQAATLEDPCHPLVLAGWLHRDTRYTALELLRKDRRRQAREQEAAQMQTLEHGDSPDDWTQIRPLLDESLDQLNADDRDALLLRFFEQRSLAEIGETLGTGEDAARKRVSRALDKLRELLTTRGITTTASALSLVLAVRSAEAIPVGLTGTLAHAALAAAGKATATSTAGILTLMTSTSLKTAAAVLAVVLVSGTVAIKLHQASARDPEPINSPTVNATKTAVGPAMNRHSSRRPKAAEETDPTLAAALARLQEVLYDPIRLSPRIHPDPAIKDAITALSDRRKAAIPLLREALQHASDEVRSRAADGLGLIGPEAREAAPDLVNLLRDRTARVAFVSATSALRKMGSMPEILPDLVQVLKENPASPGFTVMLADYLPALAGADSKLLDQTMRPLLQDSNLRVNEAAAYVLASVLKDQAGPEVVKVSIEALKSSDLNSQHLGLATLQNVGRDPGDPAQRMTAANLGPAAAEAIAALIEVVNNSKLEDRRARALKMLDELNPELRKQNPGVDAWLISQDQTEAFSRRINSGQATVPEMIEGLLQFPKATPVTAAALARLGPDARAALPALQQALVALQPPPGASEWDRSGAYDVRATVANAIQKIAPDQPKSLFTKTDLHSVFEILDGFQPDPARMQSIAAALQPAFAKLPVELTPDEMHRVLDAVKAADAPAYEALAAQVKKIDPHFFTKPAR